MAGNMYDSSKTKHGQTPPAPKPAKAQPKGGNYTGPFKYGGKAGHDPIDRTDDYQVADFKTFKNAKYIGSLNTGKENKPRTEIDPAWQRFTPREKP